VLNLYQANSDVWAKDSLRGLDEAPERRRNGQIPWFYWYCAWNENRESLVVSGRPNP
jgi:hypothetical protein